MSSWGRYRKVAPSDLYTELEPNLADVAAIELGRGRRSHGDIGLWTARHLQTHVVAVEQRPRWRQNHHDGFTARSAERPLDGERQLQVRAGESGLAVALLEVEGTDQLSGYAARCWSPMYSASSRRTRGMRRRLPSAMDSSWRIC